MRTSTMVTASAVIFVACVCSVYGQRISTIQLEGVQYFISKMNPYSPALNYFLAYQYCRSLGLQLTSFETKEKADGITQYLKNGGYNKYDFWTSGNKLGTEMYLWMSTGLPFNATFDYMTRPSSNGESAGEETPSAEITTEEEGRSNDAASGECVVLKAPDHHWETDDCREVKDFICEQTRCYYYNYGSIPVSTAQGVLKEKNAPVKLPPTTEAPISTTKAPISTTAVPTTQPPSSTPSSTTPQETTSQPPTTSETTLPPLLNFTIQRRSSLRPHHAPGHTHFREKTALNETPLRRDAVDNNRHIPRNFEGKNANTNVVYVKAVGVKDGQTGWSLAYVDKNNATKVADTLKDPEAIMVTRNNPDTVVKTTVLDPPSDS